MLRQIRNSSNLALVSLERSTAQKDLVKIFKILKGTMTTDQPLLFDSVP